MYYIRKNVEKMIKFRIFLWLLNYFMSSHKFFFLKIEMKSTLRLNEVTAVALFSGFPHVYFIPWTKSEKSKDYCKADSEQRVLFFK